MNDSNLPEEVNAALAGLRSLSRGPDGGHPHPDLEFARFRLWNALENGQIHVARAWLDTVEIAARLAPEELRAVVDRQVGIVRDYIGEQLRSKPRSKAALQK